MNENMKRYIDSIESLNSQKVAKFVLKDIENGIENYGVIEMEQAILNKKPSSPKEIITIIYILSSYAKFLQNDNMYQILKSVHTF